MKKILSGFLLFVLLSLFAGSLYLPAEVNAFGGPVYARFGGGEDFDSGGFDIDTDSGGSDFDFGGGSTTTTDWDFDSSNGDGNLGCCGGLILIIIIVVIIVFVILKNRRGGGGTGSTTTQSEPSSGGLRSSNSDSKITNKSMSSEEIQEKVDEIKQNDPDFDMQKLKTYVKKVFLTCQDAWTKRELNLARPFISEDVFQSYKMYVDQMIAQKKINVLENVVVGSVEPVRVELSKNYDRITFKIRASIKDYKVHEDAPYKVFSGDKSKSNTFTEYWVFMRKSGIATKVKDGFFDRKCPNCGAPIDVDVAGKCKYCEAMVVNGDYDWVVAEIIQKSEWDG